MKFNVEQFNQIMRRWRNKKNIASVLIGALALALLLGGYAFRSIIFPKNSGPIVPIQPVEELFRHPLTGVKSETRTTELPSVFAVMIDHSAEAWPQAGLAGAFLVIEAPVEADIPRLMAFYDGFYFAGLDSYKIGPVRSARPYFVDWANELDALYVHVGGSNEALAKIASNGTFDLNQFWYGDAFWRSTDRLAPHNTYTSLQKLDEALAKAKGEGKAPELIFGLWKFKDAVPTGETPIEPTVNIGNSYVAKWTFNMATDRYQRHQNGRAFKTEDGTELWADNVAVVITDIKMIDAVGRKEIRTLGEGAAVVFQDGRVIAGKWKKPSVSERLRFYDAAGKEIEMNAGVTWIEIISNQEKLTY